MASNSKSTALQSEAIRNRKAYHEYHILEKYVAGLVLKGTEVKSLRMGRANFVDAYARIEKGEAWLYGLDIQPYPHASHTQHEPRAARKLLLHRREIDEMHEHATTKGNTLVALSLFWEKGRAKVEIGAARGKHVADKRHTLKAKAEKRESDREMANFNRRR